VFRTIWKYLKHPYIKATLSVATALVFGLLTKAIVNEITHKNVLTDKNELHWQEIFALASFYGLVIYFVLYIIYVIATTKEEIKLREKFDLDYYKRVIEDEGLPAIADRIKSAILEENKEKLSQLIEMKNMLKNDF
jgi:protein-S-isoprenylcysteine O-methyltransferase Ste14